MCLLTKIISGGRGVINRKFYDDIVYGRPLSLESTPPLKCNDVSHLIEHSVGKLDKIMTKFSTKRRLLCQYVGCGWLSTLFSCRLYVTGFAAHTFENKFSFEFSFLHFFLFPGRIWKKCVGRYFLIKKDFCIFRFYAEFKNARYFLISLKKSASFNKVLVWFLLDFCFIRCVFA